MRYRSAVDSVPAWSPTVRRPVGSGENVQVAPGVEDGGAVDSVKGLGAEQSRTSPWIPSKAHTLLAGAGAIVDLPPTAFAAAGCRVRAPGVAVEQVGLDETC